MHADIERDARTGRRVALVGIAASAILASLNIVVGVLTQSTSVMATGVEFAGDVLDFASGHFKTPSINRCCGARASSQRSCPTFAAFTSRAGPL